MNLFPVALDVADRLCVVVGGGLVGERKTRALCEAGARVRLIAPILTAPALAEIIASGMVEHVANAFGPEHLDGALLAVAATDRPAVNAQVAKAARARGVLVNVAASVSHSISPPSPASGEGRGASGNYAGALPSVSESECLPPPPAGEGGPTGAGDFVTMATVRRGDLLVAVTTGGAGPALAARLRRELDEHFGSEWTDYVALLGEMREHARRTLRDEMVRINALRRLAGADNVRAKVASGDVDGARRLALEFLEARR